MAKVTEVQSRVSKALLKVEPGEVKVLLTSETASTTKMVEMRTLKISSVNRVMYLTRFDAEVNEDMARIPDAQIPVQPYSGRKGTFRVLANWTRQVTNAKTTPVEPIIVSGCAEVRA